MSLDEEVEVKGTVLFVQDVLKQKHQEAKLNLSTLPQLSQPTTYVKNSTQSSLMRSQVH